MRWHTWGIMAEAVRIVRSGWATMTGPVRVLVISAVAFGLATLGAVIAQPMLAGPGEIWAVNMGWTLGGVTAFCATLAAGLRREPGSAVRGAWLWWAAASVFWVAGALYRDASPMGLVTPPAGILWLIFALLSIVSFARRLPRLLLFGIFLLDALPVVLLIVAIVRLAYPTPSGTPLLHDLILNLFPALFGLSAANAIQMLGLHRDLRRVPSSVWLFTAGFCLMALASLIWAPVVLTSGSLQGHAADSLWTLGLLGLAAAGLFRAILLTGALVLPIAEREAGPHALPPAAALLGLIVMLSFVPPSERLLLQAFLLASSLALFGRVFIMRREDVRLLLALVRAQERAENAAALARRSAERLRLLASVTSRLRSLVLAELMQAICDGARAVLGARHALLAFDGVAGQASARLATSGLAGTDRAAMADARKVPQLLAALAGPAGPVRINDFSQHPAAAELPATHPPLDNFLGISVPAGASRAVLGLLGKAGGFDDEDETLVRLLASNAASAIASAQLYAESRTQQDLLTEQNERLRELDRMKDEFIAVVSHELRTPLTSIIGYLELLEDSGQPGLSSQQRDFTSVIRRNAGRLLRLVGDLLFLARLQRGELAIEHGEADLTRLCAQAVEAARPAADGKRITLHWDAGPVPAIPGDPERLAQLVDNLLSNALKFTSEGGQVSVQLGVDSRHVVLTVSDTGVGMSAQEQQRAFERFFRAGFAASQAIQGLGLGLTIVKAIVDAHGGSVSLTSKPGHGTTVRVLLPLGRVRVSHGASRQDAAGRGQPDPGQPDQGQPVKAAGRDHGGR